MRSETYGWLCAGYTSNWTVMNVFVEGKGKGSHLSLPTANIFWSATMVGRFLRYITVGS